MYQVWIEGYAATGESGKAMFMGVYEANSFAEAAEIACHEFFSDFQESLFRAGTDTTPPAYWGCRIFDNPADAMEAFG